MTKQLELFHGRLARDAGMDLVKDNNPDWFAAAMQIVIDLPPGWRGIGEDVRDTVEAKIGPPLTSSNAFGAVIAHAVKRGLLRATGRRLPMTRRASHARKSDEYVREENHVGAVHGSP
jgi:hypothetical protein